MADAIERQNTDDVVDAEFAFHRAFNRSSGRTKLAWFLLHAARYLPPHIYANDPQWGRNAVANHRKLIAALRRHDVDAVVRLTNEPVHRRRPPAHRPARRAGPLDLSV